MKTMHRTWTSKILAGLMVAVLAGCGGDPVGPIGGDRTITPLTPGTWTSQNTLTGTTAFVTGPGTPPSGTGSAEFSAGADGNSIAALANTSYHKVPISSITALTYNTWVQTPGTGQEAPYLVLNISTDGASETIEAVLIFEPQYQGVGVVTGAWQSWNAGTGQWYVKSVGPGTLTTLAAYASANPGAVIVNQGLIGGFQIVAGGLSPNWDGFEGNVDRLSITVNGQVITYDFEP